MDIIAYNPPPRHEDEIALFIENLNEFLGKADVISLHTILTEDTKHMINKESISKMKDGVFIINTARGALIDEDALVDVNMKNARQTTMQWLGFMAGSSNNHAEMPKNTDMKAVWKRTGYCRCPNTFPNNPKFKRALHEELDDIFSILVRKPFTNVKEDIDTWINRNRDIYAQYVDKYFMWINKKVTYTGFSDDKVNINKIITMIMGEFPELNIHSVTQLVRGLLIKMGGVKKMIKGNEKYTHISMRKAIDDFLMEMNNDIEIIK